MDVPNGGSTRPTRPTRLLDRVRLEARRRRLSPRTEEAYADWVRRFVRFHALRHPRELGADDVAAFLSHLAVERGVSASTQNQALAALLFLYRDVLLRELGPLPGAIRARRPRRLPTVLSRAEARRLIIGVDGVEHTVALVLYGGGLRLHEALRLRVQDLDFDRHELTVRSGKGDRDRRTMLPATAAIELRAHLERVRRLHQQDLEAGEGRVALPHALERKLRGAEREWVWQWVFPAPRFSTDPRTGATRRHHLHPDRVQRAVRAAAKAAGMKPFSNSPTGPPALRQT